MTQEFLLDIGQRLYCLKCVHSCKYANARNEQRRTGNKGPEKPEERHRVVPGERDWCCRRFCEVGSPSDKFVIKLVSFFPNIKIN